VIDEAVASSEIATKTNVIIGEAITKVMVIAVVVIVVVYMY